LLRYDAGPRSSKEDHVDPRPRLIAFAALLWIASFGCRPFSTAASYLGALVRWRRRAGRVRRIATILRSLRQVSGLAPNEAAPVTLDGVTVACLVTSASGAGAVGRNVIDSTQDPRGKHLAVVNASGVEVLVLADASHPAYRSAEFSPLASFAPGGGLVRRLTVGGEESLLVTLEGVDPGSYDVLVDGAPVGAIDATSGAGSLVLDPAAIGPDSSVTVSSRAWISPRRGRSRDLRHRLVRDRPRHACARRLRPRRCRRRSHDARRLRAALQGRDPGRSDGQL
jgi:hypothetical protein